MLNSPQLGANPLTGELISHKRVVFLEENVKIYKHLTSYWLLGNRSIVIYCKNTANNGYKKAVLSQR